MEKDILDFFNTKKNLYLVPPYVTKSDANKIISAWKDCNLLEHVFILSSGTSGHGKYSTYAISKKSLFENAKAVNTFLKASSDDVWLKSLPHFHIGGFSILVRSYLARNRVIEDLKNWNVEGVIELIREHRVTHMSLVPTQLFDLVEKKIDAPESLKGVFIGGDFLNSELESRALSLNWPLIKTYGMTETCSQIASRYCSLEKRDLFLDVLPIHRVIEEDSKTYIESSSLYTGKIVFSDGKISTSFINSNRLELPDLLEVKTLESGQKLRPMGRKSDEIKIKGRLINFLEIKDIFEKICMQENCWGKAYIYSADDERLGKKLRILVEKSSQVEPLKIVDELSRVIPFLKSSLDFKSVDNLQKTALGKTIRP